MGVEARNLDDWTERGLISGGTMGVPFVLSVTTVAATSSYDLMTPTPRGLKIINTWAVAGGAGAGDTVKLTDGTNDICTAIDVNAAAGTYAPVVTFDTSYISLAKGSTLNVTTADDAVCTIYVLCVWTD